MDLIGGLPDSRNLIACDPIELGGGSDTILKIMVEPNTTLQNRFVR